MAKIKFSNGTVVNFDGNPTPEDIEEISSQFGSSIPQPNIPDIFRRIAKSYSPQNVIRGTAPYEAITGVGEELAKTGVPTMQKVPILKDIPFGARVMGDPNAMANLFMGGGTSAGRTGVSSTAKELGSAAVPRTVKNLMQPVKFAQRVRGEFYNVKKQAVDRFGSQLDELASQNPTKSISLREVIDDISSNIDELPSEVKSIFRRTPKLGKMIESPELADKVSLKDTQDIINYINTKVPTNIKSKHIDILDTLNDIKASQLDAFEGMADVRKQYRAIAEPFKNLKNQFKFNRLLRAIETDFGGPEGKQTLKSIMPKNIIKEIGGYRNATKVIKALKGAMPWIIGGGGVLYGLGRSAERVTR